MAQWTAPGTHRRLHEVVRGPHVCLFADSTFPPPPVQICEETKSPTGEGGLISAERYKPRGRTERERLQQSRPLPYRPPERWGNDQKHLKTKGSRNKGNTLALGGSTEFYSYFYS